MFKGLLISTIILFSQSAFSDELGQKKLSSSELKKYCSAYKFNNNQKKVLNISYALGKRHGLGFSLAAIAWRESSAGEYLMNLNDPSFGVYHILLKTAKKRTGIKGLKSNKLAYALTTNIRLSASFAIKELNFWKKTLKGSNRNWINVWSAYNGGFNYKKKIPQSYGKDIKKKVDWLATCYIK